MQYLKLVVNQKKEKKFISLVMEMFYLVVGGEMTIGNINIKERIIRNQNFIVLWMG